MIQEDVRFINSTVFEGMTSIRAIIRAWDDGIAKRQINEILYDGARIAKISKEIGYLKAVSEKYGFSVRESTADEINGLTLGNSHGGIIAITEERVIPCLSDKSEIKPDGFYCMIQGIEDPYNFGYSLRSLYACGCDGIILPERNWMSAAGVVARSSAGASELLPMFTADPIDTAKHFKALGYTIVCAEEKTENVLGKCEMKLPILLIVGGEKRGISKALVDLADTLVKIDYAREFRASLSAASATTMFAYEIMRQNS